MQLITPCCSFNSTTGGLLLKRSFLPDLFTGPYPQFLEINQEGGTVRLEFAVEAEIPTGEYAIGIIKVSM